jgi:type VI secretion system protein ImpG
MEYFLGQYVSMNSFSQLIAKSAQRKEIIRQWQPRAGQSILL